MTDGRADGPLVGSDSATEESTGESARIPTRNEPVAPESVTIPFGLGPDQAAPYLGFDENWWTDSSQRYRALGRTLWWTFVPHDQNAATRKIVTTILMGTWMLVTVGAAFGFADPGQYYPWISVVALSIVCTIWGFELGALDAMTKANARPAQRPQQERQPPAPESQSESESESREGDSR